MWSLFLIGHLHLGGVWHGLWFKIITKKECGTMRLDDVLKIETQFQVQLGGPM